MWRIWIVVYGILHLTLLPTLHIKKNPEEWRTWTWNLCLNQECFSLASYIYSSQYSVSWKSLKDKITHRKVYTLWLDYAQDFFNWNLSEGGLINQFENLVVHKIEAYPLWDAKKKCMWVLCMVHSHSHSESRTGNTSLRRKRDYKPKKKKGC